MTGGLPALERKEMIHGRVKARQIVAWVLTTYELQGDLSLEEFYWSYLSYQSRAIYNSKVFAEEHKVFSLDRRATADDVRDAIGRCFDGIPQFWEKWHVHKDVATYAWPVSRKYDLKVKDRTARIPGASIPSAVIYLCISQLPDTQSNFLGSAMDTLVKMKYGQSLF
jgi:hypothetical protein